MMPNAPQSRLSEVRVLQTLPDRALRSLARRCKWERFRPGEYIVRRHDGDSDVFFVIEGRVRAIHYLTDRQVILSEIGPGGHFGEFAAIDDGERSASVVAIDNCLVARMGADEFKSLLRRHFDMALAIMRHLVQVIRTSDQRVADLSALGAMQRVYGELLRLADPDEDAPGTSWIAPMPSQSSIAKQVQTTRETVARTLARLARDGLIERDAGRLRIMDTAKLKSLIDQLPSGGE